jgi:WD40 repeat protein
LILNLSDDGLYAAHVNGKDLVVYTNPASENKETQMARIKENGVKYLRFCPSPASSRGPNGNSERRLLSANDSRITVWQLEPLQIFAEIENLEPGALSIDFGSDGNEILVFHAWNTKLTIHSLGAGRSSVIKTPKAAHALGFGYRPQTRQFAILLKPDASDLLTIHAPQSYELVGRAILPTIDAQGLKWSPDGKWIAVWDVASGGTKVLIFTADGQLFRTYTRPAGSDEAFDLGVKQIEWSPAAGPNGPSEVLAVGKVNGTIDLLRTRTVRYILSLSTLSPL